MESSKQSEQPPNPHQNGEKDFIMCSQNGSDIASVKSLDEKSDNSLDFGFPGRTDKSGHSSISSFSEVHSLDMEPKLGKAEHEDDVTTLMADAQLDVEPTDQNSVSEDKGRISPVVPVQGQSWFSAIRKYSEYEDVDSSEVQVAFVDDSDGSDEATNNAIEISMVDSGIKDACVFYHNVTYLGSSSVNAPVSEIELKRTISIMRDHANISLDVILAVGLSSDGCIRLIDPVSRQDMAAYDAKQVIFWGKADDESKEKDCVAFNVAHGEDSFHCHVFRCDEEDTAGKIVQSFSNILRKNRKEKQAADTGLKQIRLDPNNLSFKYDVTIDILEEDSKGIMAQVARDKNCFKLRQDVNKRVVICLEQLTNKTLAIERCFGLLLSPGKNVEHQNMHLLDQVQMESRNSGRVSIIYGTWNPAWPDMKVLNTETQKDKRVFISVAADLIFSDLKEPVRIVKESKVKVFPNNEKFWNPSKPRLHEEYSMELKENFLDSGERYFELSSLLSSSALAKSRHTKSRESSLLSRVSSKKSSFISDSSADEEPVEIMGPEEEDDEPLLSGSGKVEKEYTEEELAGWSEMLEKWKDYQTRPKQLVQLVRKGVPDQMRGDIWLRLADVDLDSEILHNYSMLTKKDSPNEQVIVWDVTRTFPAHEAFKEVGGQGQESLMRICKAYSVYDEDIGYCQGMSYLIAVLLLHMPEEQAFCLLVKILKDYGHRKLFQDNFELLHQRFYIMERLLEDYLPTLQRHFQSIGIEAHMYASQWLLTLFTSKFPLPLVFSIMDTILCEGCDISYQIALALLKDSQKDFERLDFEGALKHFRVYMPKKYMEEEQCRQFLNVVFSLKVSKKRIMKYEKEYLQIKEEMEQKEDPVKRFNREKRALMEENMRLHQENDSLAHEIVETQVSMQEKITELEDKVNGMLIERERTTKHLRESEEEVERLKTEEIRVKDIWRESAKRADIEREKRDRIIEDYKKICTDLEDRNEKFKVRLQSDLSEIKNKVRECPNCSKYFERPNASPTGNEPEAKDGLQSTLQLLQDDDKQKIISLENELISAKLSLAEAREYADHLELKLHSANAAASEKSWFKKITNQNRK